MHSQTVSCQFSALNFHKIGQTKVKIVWKGKHIVFAAMYDELKWNELLSRTWTSWKKYIGNLLGLTENIDLKQKV